MVDQCFACKKPKNLTLEHVIPQALGGRLKERLYCKDCNDTFGHELDDILSKNFGKFGTLLNIKREEVNHNLLMLLRHLNRHLLFSLVKVSQERGLP